MTTPFDLQAEDDEPKALGGWYSATPQPEPKAHDNQAARLRHMLITLDKDIEVLGELLQLLNALILKSGKHSGEWRRPVTRNLARVADSISDELSALSDRRESTKRGLEWATTGGPD